MKGYKLDIAAENIKDKLDFLDKFSEDSDNNLLFNNEKIKQDLSSYAKTTDIPSLDGYAKTVDIPTFTNKDLLDKLSLSEDGKILYNNKKISNIGSVIVVLYSNEDAGKTITLKINNSTYTQIVDSVNYQVIFEGIPEIGRYSITEESIEGSIDGSISTYGYYKINTNYNYEDYLIKGGYNGNEFSSLDEIFSDEKVTRKLMTIHASADYLIAWYNKNTSVLDTIIANKYAMKWLGLRDYICDKFLAISAAKTALLASDYWKYILKDSVPIMTGNSLPYGTASGGNNDRSGGTNIGPDYAYVIFDGNDSTDWDPFYYTDGNDNNNYYAYKFPTPICLNKFGMLEGGKYKIQIGRVQYSNDGSTWTDVYTFDDSSYSKIWHYHSFDNETYALYWRIKLDKISNSEGLKGILYTLQFYGRALNVATSYIKYPEEITTPNVYLNNVTYFTDKTEREYADNTNIKCIYDHGYAPTSLTISGSTALCLIDVTDNNYLISKNTGHATTSDKLQCGDSSATVNGLPYNNYLDISNVNGENSVGWASRNVTYLEDETELWLK